MSTPIYGKSGVVKKGTMDLALIEDIRVECETDVVIARAMGSDWAVGTAYGPKTVRVEVGKFFTASTEILSEFINGAELTIEIHPQGTGTGKPKLTITGAIIQSWGYSQPHNEYIRERVRFIGKDIAEGTQ